MNEPQHARVGDDDRPGTSPVPGGSPTDAGVAASGDGSPAEDVRRDDRTSAGDAATAVIPTAATGAAADEPRPDDDEHAQAVAGWRARTAKRRRGRKRPWWVEVPLLLVTAFLLTFLIQTFLFKVYYVPSGSMEPTLHGVEVGGDRILVNKIVYDFRDPAPGDIVVFKGPDNWTPEINAIPGPTSFLGKVGEALGSVVGIAPPNEKDFVKRVIAVGGQTVKCCDAQGRVEVDGVPLDEPYVQPGNEIPFTPGAEDCSTSPESARCFGPVTVPQGQLWVMGDNRAGSGDSSLYCQGGRPPSECQGPVPISNVIGKAIFIIMPISRWDTLGDPGIDHRGG